MATSPSSYTKLLVSSPKKPAWRQPSFAALFFNYLVSDTKPAAVFCSHRITVSGKKIDWAEAQVWSGSDGSGIIFQLPSNKSDQKKSMFADFNSHFRTAKTQEQMKMGLGQHNILTGLGIRIRV